MGCPRGRVEDRVGITGRHRYIFLAPKFTQRSGRTSVFNNQIWTISGVEFKMCGKFKEKAQSLRVRYAYRELLWPAAPGSCSPEAWRLGGESGRLEKWKATWRRPPPRHSAPQRQMQGVSGMLGRRQVGNGTIKHISVKISEVTGHPANHMRLLSRRMTWDTGQQRQQNELERWFKIRHRGL